MAASNTMRLAVGGLGAIGLAVARAVDQGRVPGFELAAVSARDQEKAKQTLAGFRKPPALTTLAGLADAGDVIVEGLPSALFADIAEPALAKGKVFMPLSVGALLKHMHLVDLAKSNGGRIVVPTGALLGLDAVRATAEGKIESVRMITRKPPAGLKGAPLLVEKNISVDNLKEPLRIFEGSARDAIVGFPANVNVAVALSLAGIGPDATRIEIWADPGVTRNTHTIKVVSDSSDLTLTIENIPSLENPRTGRITALSVLAALRRMTAPLVVGS